MKDPAGPKGPLFRRLVLSDYDLREAERSHKRLLELHEPDLPHLGEAPDAEAHTTRLVTAYARPFTKTRRSDHPKTPPTLKALPGRFRRSFSREEAKMHKRLMGLRNEEFAHSSADAATVTVAFVEGAPQELTAVSRRTRMPFWPKDLETIGECIRKLRQAIAAEQVALRSEILEHLRAHGQT